MAIIEWPAGDERTFDKETGGVKSVLCGWCGEAMALSIDGARTMKAQFWVLEVVGPNSQLGWLGSHMAKHFDQMLLKTFHRGLTSVRAIRSEDGMYTIIILIIVIIILLLVREQSTFRPLHINSPTKKNKSVAPGPCEQLDNTQSATSLPFHAGGVRLQPC
jgi:hypothetical protein